MNTLLCDGRYTLGKCLSLDGEGVLYAAVDGKLSRRVAIKEYVPVTICASRTKEGQVIARPEREVLFKTTRMDFVDLYRSLASLGKQNGLAQVYDLFEENNTAYAVREPADGVPFLAYLQTRKVPLTQTEAITLLRPVVYGVEMLHRCGLLHRGISPETVFITADGRATLSGYATMGLRTADSELKSQLYEGYAAPEQYAVAEFDGKYTDVYALAALFYRAMTGKVPATARLRRKNDTLIAPDAIEPNMPAFVSAALMRALRLDPAQRIQTVSELLCVITEPSKEDTEFHFTKRQIRYIAMGGAALVLVLLLSLWAIFSTRAPKLSSSESSSSQVESVSTPSLPQNVILPNFSGKLYREIQTNPEYSGNFIFSAEEEYSSDYAVGQIISQQPEAGTEIELGSTVKLVISLGPKTAVMPVVVGKSRADAETALRVAGIPYTIVDFNNEGAYEADIVAKCDTVPDKVLDIHKDKVVLYVTTAPPVKSEPTDDSEKEDNTSSHQGT